MAEHNTPIYAPSDDDATELGPLDASGRHVSDPRRGRFDLNVSDLDAVPSSDPRLLSDTTELGVDTDFSSLELPIPPSPMPRSVPCVRAF